MTPPVTTRFGALLELQRLAGNRAVTRLLGEVAPLSDSQATLQRVEAPSDEALKAHGARMKTFSESAPATNAFMWKLTKGAAELFLLGTVHTSVWELWKFGKATAILDFLKATEFDLIFQELGHDVVSDVGAMASTIREFITLEAARPPEPAKEGSTARQRVEWQKYTLRRSALEQALGQNAPLVDDFFAQLAAKGKAVGDLEPGKARAQIRAAYSSHKGEGPNKGLGFLGEDLRGEEAFVMAGNQKALAAKRAGELMGEGGDSQDTEARNRHWIGESQKLGESPYEGKRVLWVVGAGHIGGIVVNLQPEGWTASVVPL